LVSLKMSEIMAQCQSFLIPADILVPWVLSHIDVLRITSETECESNIIIHYTILIAGQLWEPGPLKLNVWTISSVYPSIIIHWIPSSLLHQGDCSIKVFPSFLTHWCRYVEISFYLHYSKLSMHLGDFLEFWKPQEF